MTISSPEAKRCILVTVEEGVAWATFNRPEKRNAINPSIAFPTNKVLDGAEHGMKQFIDEMSYRPGLGA